MPNGVRLGAARPGLPVLMIMFPFMVVASVYPIAPVSAETGFSAARRRSAISSRRASHVGGAAVLDSGDRTAGTDTRQPKTI